MIFFILLLILIIFIKLIIFIEFLQLFQEKYQLLELIKVQLRQNLNNEQHTLMELLDPKNKSERQKRER